MVGVRRRAAGDHADEVTGRDGVGRGAAKALAGVFAFDAAFGQGQAAGAHGAVFTAGALDTDIALLHVLAADGVLGVSFSLLIFLIAFSIVCIRILL
jgi:hypothetical protein